MHLSVFLQKGLQLFEDEHDALVDAFFVLVAQFLYTERHCV